MAGQGAKGGGQVAMPAAQAMGGYSRADADGATGGARRAKHCNAKRHVVRRCKHGGQC